MPPVTTNLSQEDIGFIDYLAADGDQSRSAWIREAILQRLYGAPSRGSRHPGTATSPERPRCPSERPRCRRDHARWGRDMPMDRILTSGGGWACPGILPDGSACGFELAAAAPLAIAQEADDAAR